MGKTIKNRNMKAIFSILFICFLILVSCKSGQKMNQTKEVETLEHYFSMYRGACYGKCPAYKIEIQKDGSFVYFGKSYVKNIGEKNGELSKEQTENLFEALSKYDWNSYLEEYPIDNVDFPSFSIEYANGKTLKTVKGNLNAPKELQELTRIVDALLKGIGY